MCSRPRISFSGWKSLSSAATRLPMFLARSPIRSRSVATRMAPTISRRSTAIGWRRAMVSTARSSITRCRLSISASAVTTRLPSSTSRRISASTESTIMRSARPPISATNRVNSCRSPSNALAVCSEAMNVSSAEPAGNVVLGAPIAGRGEDPAGFVEFDQFAEIHERGLVRDARGLLHVVGDDGDGVVFGQFLDQFLDLGGRDRIQRRARLVEQDHLGPYRDGAGDAQALLLAAGQALAIGVELVLDFVPQRGAAQRGLDAAVEIGFRQPLIEPDAEGDVFVDRHRKRRRLLEHHADARAQQIEILLRRQNVDAVEQHFAGGALVRIKVVHAVEHAQQRRLAATGRADEGGDLVLVERQADRFQRSAVAIEEIQVAEGDLVGKAGAIGGGVGDAGYGDTGDVHDCLPDGIRARAEMLKASTASVMMRAPVQASACQS